MSAVEIEGDWLASLDRDAKVLFLAKLGHTLTVAGRNSYTVQGEGLANPAQLRHINEIQHRVLACLVEVLEGKSTVSFQRSVAVWVLEQSDPEVRDLGSWAWRSAKEHVS
jgi:hypothetical protein